MALRLRVNEAIARSEATNLCNGTTKRIVPEWVVILCEMLDCTADYLFGMEGGNNEK